MNGNYGFTPTQAKEKKKCPIMPMVTERWYNGASGVTEEQKPRPCLGDDCMMWTWLQGSEVLGYCGLRGKVVIP